MLAPGPSSIPRELTMRRVQAVSALAPRRLSRGESDAAILVQRVGHEIASLAKAVGGLQKSLGPALAAAAVEEPGLMLEAQKLDLIEQTLHGLSTFLAAVGRCRIGSEPLDLQDYAATLSLAGLAGRLAGQDVEEGDEDLELF